MNTMLKVIIFLLFNLYALSSFSFNLQQLNGEWSTHNKRVANSIFKVDFSILNNKFTHTINLSIKAPLFPPDEFSHKIEGEIVSFSHTDRNGVYLLQIKVKKVWEKFHSTSTIAMRNQKKYCTKSNWQVGVFNEITNLPCKQEENDPVEIFKTDEIIPFSIQAINDGSFYANINIEDNFTDQLIQDPSSINLDHPVYKLK